MSKTLNSGPIKKIDQKFSLTNIPTSSATSLSSSSKKNLTKPSEPQKKSAFKGASPRTKKAQNIPKSPATASSSSNSAYLVSDNDIQMVSDDTDPIVILDGSLNKNGRSIYYSIHESSGSYFSINLFVQSTKQKWSIFVPIIDDLQSLTKMWKSSPKYANKKLLAGWLLSCSNLEFTNDIIINATFDTTKFRTKCRPYITQLLNETATRIQSLGRMFLARKKVQRKRILHKKKLKKLRNLKLKEKLSESHSQVSPEDLMRNNSATSIATEYSTTAARRNEIKIGSSLETNSSIFTDLPSGSSLLLLKPSPPVKGKKSSQKHKTVTPPIIRRMKETISAYSSSPSTSADKRSSPRSHPLPNNSLSQGSFTVSSDLMDQIKYLKNDLSSALHHQAKETELSKVKELMKAVLSEVKALRYQNSNHTGAGAGAGGLGAGLGTGPESAFDTATRSPINRKHSSSSSLENVSENQFELKQNLHTMLSQIQTIQQDLSEQKILSTHISLQLKEQNHVMSSLTNNTATVAHKHNSNLQTEILQDEQEKSFITMKNLEMTVENSRHEIERLQQLLMTKDREYQKELLKSSTKSTTLQKEYNNLKTDLEETTENLKETEKKINEKKNENEKLKQIIQNLEKENYLKHQELMNQINQTVTKLKSTQNELEEYQYTVEELNQNYQNSLVQITCLQNQISGMERHINEKNQENDEIQQLEREKNEFQQKLFLSEQKITTFEKTIASLQEKNRQLTDEIAVNQLFLSKSSEDSQEQHRNYLNLQKETEKMKLENENMREIIGEKDSYITNMQAKFTELEIKSQKLHESQSRDSDSLKSLTSAREEDMRVNHYLRSRLKEAEEKIFLLEQHQLEVENLKYEAIIPPPYEIKPTTEIKPTSEIEFTSTSLVNKLLVDQQLIQARKQSERRTSTLALDELGNFIVEGRGRGNSEDFGFRPGFPPFARPLSRSKSSREQKSPKKELVPQSPLVTEIEWFDWMDKTVPPNDEELQKIRHIAATRIINFFRSLKSKFRITVLLTMIPQTQDSLLIQESLSLALIYRHERLATVTLKRIYKILLSVHQVKPTVLHQILCRLLFPSKKLHISSYLQQLLIYFHSNFEIYDIITDLLYFLMTNPSNETISLLYDDESTSLIPISLLLSTVKDTFLQSPYLAKVIEIQLLLCRYHEQYKKKFFNNIITCEVLNTLLSHCHDHCQAPTHGPGQAPSPGPGQGQGPQSGTDSEHKVFLEHLLQFLSLLCQDNPLIFHLMGEKGICQSLIDLLVLYPHHPAFVTLISDTLIQLTYTHQPNQLIVGSKQNLNTFLQLLSQQWSNNHKLVKHIFHIITNLCPNDVILFQNLPHKEMALLLTHLLNNLQKNMNFKILKAILILIPSLLRNLEFKEELLRLHIITILETIQIQITSQSLLKLFHYAKRQLDGSLQTETDSESSLAAKRYSQKILRPSFSDSEFSQISNIPTMSNERKEVEDNPSLGFGQQAVNKRVAEELQRGGEEEEEEGEECVEGDVENLLNDENNAEIARSKIQNALSFYLKKKRFNSQLDSIKLKLPTILLMIDTTNDTPTIMEAILVAYQLQHEVLTIKILKRCNLIIKEAKKNKKHSTLVAQILQNPVSLIQLVLLFKDRKEIQVIVLTFFTRMTYATNGNEVLGKNGIFQWLYELLVIYQHDEQLLTSCLTLATRLLKLTQNRKYGIQERYLKSILKIIQSYEYNMELVERYCQFILLGLEDKASGNANANANANGGGGRGAAEPPAEPPAATGAGAAGAAGGGGGGSELSTYQELFYQTGHSHEILKLYYLHYHTTSAMNESFLSVISRLCSNQSNSNISYFLSKENLLRYFQEISLFLDQQKEGFEEKLQYLCTFLIKLLVPPVIPTTLNSSSSSTTTATVSVATVSTMIMTTTTNPSYQPLYDQYCLSSLDTYTAIQQLIHLLIQKISSTSTPTQTTTSKYLQIILNFLLNIFKISSIFVSYQEINCRVVAGEAAAVGAGIGAGRGDKTKNNENILNLFQQMKSFLQNNSNKALVEEMIMLFQR